MGTGAGTGGTGGNAKSRGDGEKPFAFQLAFPHTPQIEQQWCCFGTTDSTGQTANPKGTHNMRISLNNRLTLSNSVAFAAEAEAGTAAGTAEAAAPATGDSTDLATAKAAAIFMSDDTTNGGAKAMAALKSKDGLNGYRATFDNFEAAVAKVNSLINLAATHAGERARTLPVIVAGHAGPATTLEEIPAWGADRVGVSLMTVKQKAATGVRALVVYPMPSVDAYMNDSNGSDWLTKVADKETSHVAFRHLRNVAETDSLAMLYSTAGRMPVTVDAYAQETREGGLDASSFNEVWGDLRKAINQRLPEIGKALPQRAEVIKAIRSKSYAIEAGYADLERRSIFVFIAQKAIELIDRTNEADAASELETSEIESWVAGRETLNLQVPARQELTGDVDLSAFTLG